MGNGSRKMSISVILELVKSNFEKGINSVNATINKAEKDFKLFFASFTVGMSALRNLYNSLKQTAIESERTRIALKNVTDGMLDMSRAQSFVGNVAKKYGQDIIALSQGYIGFTAAARQANVPLDDQEAIFESLSKACATYGLDAQRTSLVMLALTQMMSKGKISAEELRRQMGEHLPVAYEAMARASGLTTAQFEKMMGEGKILSKDILPKFAEEMNNITADADFDNFATSWTKLTNTLKQSVADMGLPQKVKPLLDWLNGAVTTLVEHIRVAIFAIIGLFGGRLFDKLRIDAKKMGATISEVLATKEAESEAVATRIADKERQVASARLAVEKATEAERMATATGGEKAIEQARVKRQHLEAQLNAQEVAHKKLTEEQKALTEINKQAELSAIRKQMAEERKTLAMQIAEEEAKIEDTKLSIKQANAEKRRAIRQKEEADISRANVKILSEKRRLAEQEVALARHKSEQEVLQHEKASQRYKAIQEERARQQAVIAQRIAQKEQQITRTRLALEKACKEEQVAIETNGEAQILQARQARHSKEKALAKQETELHKLMEEQKVVDKQKADAQMVASTYSTAGTMKRIWISLTASMKALWASVQAMIMTSIVGIIATAVGALVGEISKLIKQANEARKLAKEVEEAYNRTDADRTNIAKTRVNHDDGLLRDNLNMLKDGTTNEEQRTQARAVLRNRFGVHGNSDAELIKNAELEEKIRQKERELELTDEDLSNADKLATSMKDEIAGRMTSVPYVGTRKLDEAVSDYKSTYGTTFDANKFADISLAKPGSYNSKLAEKYFIASKAQEIFRSKRSKTAGELEVLREQKNSSTSQPDTYGAPAVSAKQDYYKEKEQLDKQRAIGTISAEEYDQKLSDISKETLNKLVTAIGVEATKNDELYAELASNIIEKATSGGKSKTEQSRQDLIAEAEQEYVKSLKEIANKYEAGAITEKERISEELNVSKRHVETLGALCGAEAQSIASYQQAATFILEHTDELKQVKDEFLKEADKLNKKYVDRIIDEDEYRSQLQALIQRTIDQIYSSDELTQAQRDEAKRLRERQQKEGEKEYEEESKEVEHVDSAPVLARAEDLLKGNYSTATLKSELGDLREIEEQSFRTLDTIHDMAKDAGFGSKAFDRIVADAKKGRFNEQAMSELKGQVPAMVYDDAYRGAKNAFNIHGATKAVEWKEQYQKSQEKVFDAKWNVFKSAVSTANRLTQSVKRLKEVLENPDISAWEKFLSVLNAMIQVVDTIKGVKAAIESLNAVQKTAAKLAEAGVTASQAKGTAEIATSKAVTAAKVTETSAKTTAAYAGMPFVGVALATAAIGALIALITSNAGKFESGGIVGGNSFSGDRMMAMVNSGEMILNQGQQARLFRLANKGAEGQSSQSTVVVGGSITARGDKLRVVLKKDAVKTRRL